jgi:hypothetical protein
MAEATMKRSEKAEIDAKIAKLRERKKVLEKKEGERFAKLAAEAGLMDIEISDDALRTGLEELAARFQATGTKPSPAVGAAAQSSGKAAGQDGNRNG